ncbi:MAG: calcium-translocating P-type ATPase, PMCA-type, partial [Clostridia bacterium]|nr:calcium-translocating P-type ATPase, PMCA-type [Clostridia bacterium]
MKQYGGGQMDNVKERPECSGRRKTRSSWAVEFKKSGLSPSEVEKSRERYGKNILSKKTQETFVARFLKSFGDPIIRILLGALVINTVTSLGRINWAETLGIAAAILIATLVSTISEHSSSLAYSRLCQGADKGKCTVIRGGVARELAPADIVVGDRVLIIQGMSIPADGVLNEGEVYCDQASLTGESREVAKRSSLLYCAEPETYAFDLHSESQLFGGTLAVRGEGEMTVLRVGDRTFMGEIAGDLQESSRPSPLKRRLSDLASSIGFLGYLGAFMIAFAYLFNSFFIDSGMDMALVRERLSDTPFLISEILRAVTVAVSVVVVAVPEGLPMMITVVLSSNMKKMMQNGVLVRRLVGIETAGNLSILFTDKTGTLTTGKMKVVKALGADWEAGLEKSGAVPNIKLISKGIAAACTPNSSATEKALYALCKTGSSRKSRLPFSSENKFSAGLCDDGQSFFAGAPEVLLSHCSSRYDKEGRVVPMHSSDLREIADKQKSLADNACRVLCIAVGDMNSFEEAKNKRLSDITFLALLAIRDPVRRDVRRCVKDCHAAGIQVVMVTGDNLNTAEAVARETGIVTDEKHVILSADRLHKMTDDELKSILPRLAVVSRALPSDKIRLVRVAEECSLVVGMTGDGINDAPALKAADVGFAMGSGTDIAKDAGDIVITDDSFTSVTRAVLYGRTIFRSIRKFIVFQLLMNLSAMGISLIGPFVGIDSPVTVIQMLWVNIIMDTLGGLAFAGEPAMRSYMLTKSPPSEEKLINGSMLSQILITGGYTLALGLFFLKSPYVRAVFGGSDLYYLTAFFAMFIFCGIFNSFNARTESVNILSCIAGNKPFIFIMTLVGVVQLLIIYFGGEVFRCTPLAPVHLLY